MTIFQINSSGIQMVAMRAGSQGKRKKHLQQRRKTKTNQGEEIITNYAANSDPSYADNDIVCLTFTPNEISNYFRREKQFDKQSSVLKEDQVNRENSNEHEFKDKKGGKKDQIDFSKEEKKK